MPIILALVFASCSTQSKLVRDPIIINNGQQLYNLLLDSLYVQQDSIALWNRDGVVFFRMQFINNHFENIRSSEDGSPTLQRIVSKVVSGQEVRVNVKSAERYYFVLPVRYYFADVKPGSAIMLVNMAPKIDINNTTDKPVNWFNKFFDMDTAESEVKGSPCIMLPWLSVKGKVQ